MSLQIRNSLTKTVEPFVPLKPGHVSMYVCGPTVYDEPHLGHLRSAYTFETMRRYMEYSGLKVRLVRNVTDVDDKINQKALEAKPSDLVAEVRRVAERYHAEYLRDVSMLGVRAPDVEPKATAHITEMVSFIEALIQKGAAYESGGDVYFDIKRFPEYGKLSHQDTEAMVESVRIEPNERKKDPLDFALWKRSNPDEPSWPSPWGGGRPGWHIECSAMSMKYLGETFDIHGGGRDLIFPHHENEIAQSETRTGKPFARVWVHHGLVTIDKQKMSKSAKNYLTLAVLASKGHSTEIIKLLLLGTHYSSALDYSEAHMKMEHAVWRRFYFFFEEVRQLGVSGDVPTSGVERFETAFREAMDDDFNTPQAIAVFHDILHEARKSRDANVMRASAALLARLGGVFGIFQDLDAFFQAKQTEAASFAEDVDRRAAAKKAGDYQAADAIRDALSKRGVTLTDLKDGRTLWRRVE